MAPDPLANHVSEQGVLCCWVPLGPAFGPAPCPGLVFQGRLKLRVEKAWQPFPIDVAAAVRTNKAVLLTYQSP